MTPTASANSEWSDLDGFHVPKHSKREINAVGEKLRGFLPYPYSDETVQIFRTVHELRLAHVEPMRRARRELSTAARKLSESGLTAGRLKRISSIRNKLRRTPLTLYDIQDIGGCRAIMPDMDSVRALVGFYDGGSSRYQAARHWRYIDEPKPSGYRSHHITLHVRDEDGVSITTRRRIEVQLRTRLQHAWATAVEAVGLVNDQDLKAGRGCPRWLRLFTLMSSVIAAEEGCPTVPGTPADRAELLNELAEVEAHLGAIANLHSYNEAIRLTNEYARMPGQSFVVEYDNINRSVRVRSNTQFRLTAEASFVAETSQEYPQAVLIEVDRVGDLRAAYPNYFLDVQLFTDRMAAAVTEARRSRPGRHSVASEPGRKWGSLSWLRDNYGKSKD
ncbi:RelA/SpoT domain-containing protein [Brevundimonas sp.]|uniref:RelA/SpoT domain-containing protein n=1 Tax=Brevundimonas sp. TaxID=1871086 RepID=UPI002D755978|nr:RelA/SpoT domain-containing protein [Brevundimonas sp.]HYD26937.1 RelA/SpoT domain-containing protein [Brevundimonas sp.]